MRTHTFQPWPGIYACLGMRVPCVRASYRHAAGGTALWLPHEAVGPARLSNGQSQRWHDDLGSPFPVFWLCLCVRVRARGRGREGICM